MRRFLFLPAVLLFFCFSAYSQNESEEVVNTNVSSEESVSEENLTFNWKDGESEEGVAAGGIGFRQVLSLLFGILLIAFFLFVLFRYFKGLTKPSVTPTGGFFRILATEALFGSRYIHLVKAGTQYYLIASADSEITLLEKIGDQEMIQAIELYVSSVPSEPQTFQERLMSAIQKTKVRISVDEAARKVSGQFKKHGDKFKKM